MRSITYFLVCGVALLAAPFLCAQENGNIALEMQALQREIAELRDMVEVQQYKMRKLQAQIEVLESRSRATPRVPPPRPGSTYSVDTPPSESRGTLAPGEIDINDGSTEIPESGVADQVIIEDRDLNPKTPPPGASDQPYIPPVEDRSVTDNDEDDGTPSSPGVEQVEPKPNTASTPIIPVPGAAKEQDIDYETELYQQAFDLLKQGKHDDAVLGFKRLIQTFPNGEQVDDAHYWIGESFLINNSLDSARLHYRTIMENHPQSPRLPDAMLRMAHIEHEQGNRIEARILLNEIMQFHPRSNAAISARNRLESLK